MPFIGFLILLILFFLGLLFIMYKVLGSQAQQVTDQLSEMNMDFVKKNEELKKMQSQTAEESRVKLAQTQEEMDKMKRKGLQETEEEKRRILEQARNEAEKLVEEAHKNRQALKEELELEMNVRAIDRACELIQGLLSEQLRTDAHTRWLDELINVGLKDINRAGDIEDGAQAKIITAFPLTDAQKEKIKLQISTSLGINPELNIEVDPSIIAGLSITLGHLVIDGSLASKLREAAQRAQNATG